MSVVETRSEADRNGQSSAGKRIGAGKREKSLARRKTWLVILLLGLVAIGGAVLWCYQAVRIISTDDAFIDGHVIQVCPKIAAHVVALHFEDNYFVHKGDLLLELDPRDFEVKVKSANANLSAAESRVAQVEAQEKVADADQGQARAELVSAQANADNALKDLHRNQQLIKKHVIDQREIDQSTAQSAMAQASLEGTRKKVESAGAQTILCAASCASAKAELEQAKLHVTDAELQLSYTRVYACEDGRITKKGVEPGDYVQPGQTLFLLVPPEIWVTANFKETQLRKLQIGQVVSIRVDADSHLYRGHVESFQSGTGSRFTLLPTENATGNYVKVVQRVPVKIVFDELAQDLTRLRPGESVEPVVDIVSSSDCKPVQPLPPAMLGDSKLSSLGRSD